MGMRILRRGLVSLLAVALGGPACGKVDPLSRSTNDDTNEVEDGANALLVEPGTLEFVHAVGSSPCPQLVGRLTIANVGFSDKLVEVVVFPPLRTNLRENLTAVAGGRSVEVEVYFDCSAERDFTSRVEVYFVDDLVRNVTVRGTVGTL